MKSNYQNVLKLFKKTLFSGIKRVFFQVWVFFFLLLLLEFYISVPVAGGNSFVFYLKNCKGAEMLPQTVLVSLT